MWRAIWISLIFQLGVSANFLGQSDTPISPALRDVIKKSHDQKDVIPIASFFLGLPYLANKLSNSSPENIYYSFNDFDCVTFVENVWALYYSKGIDRLFQKRLIQIRYQNQVSFEERQHYLTSALQKMVYLNLLSPLNNAKNSFKVYKDIHYLSTFLKKNNRNFDIHAIREKEKNISSKPFFYFTSEQIKKHQVDLKQGDIVGFLSKSPNLDFKHVGFIYYQNGIPYLLHASQEKHVICKSETSLDKYLDAHPQFLGVQIYRPNLSNE